MKRVIISLLILSFSILFCAFSYSVIENKLTYITEELNECADLIDYKQISDAENKANEIYAYWQNSDTNIRLFVSSEICDEAQDELDSILICISNSNLSQAKQSIYRSIDIIEEIIDKEKLSFDAVF